MVTVEDVRTLALTLPRTTEHLIYDRVKFRVGAIVYVAFSQDETTMGFGYPREERDALIASDPDLFFLPRPSDLRFHVLSQVRIPPRARTSTVRKWGAYEVLSPPSWNNVPTKGLKYGGHGVRHVPLFRAAP
jgi:hypothetical protein